REIEEVRDMSQSDDQTKGRWQRETLFVVEETGSHEPYRAAARLQGTAAIRQDVLDPIGSRTIGEGDDVAPSPPKNIHWRVVGTMRFATGMGDDAEAGEEACQRAQEVICHHAIEACNRSRYGHAGASLPWVRYHARGIAGDNSSIEELSPVEY